MALENSGVDIELKEGNKRNGNENDVGLHIELDKNELGKISEPEVENTTDEESEMETGTKLGMWIEQGRKVIGQWLIHNKELILIVSGVILVFGFLAYLIYACIYHFDGALALVVMTALTVAYLAWALFRDNFGKQTVDSCCVPLSKLIDDAWPILRWVVYIILVGLLIGFFVWSYLENPRNLISAAGIIVFMGFLFIFSKYPGRVRWRTVLWGYGIQLVLGIIIIRTSWGYATFEWLGDQVSIFLDYSLVGAEFVFGEVEQHYFAFVVLPIIVYFSSFISICYYLGIVQFVIGKIAWLMQYSMQTSPAESLNAAANIFIGQTEAPLLIRPFLDDMTKSELHAVMTGGFATVAGSVLGAYISFGISASSLISASVISAPASLAISKLFYPETERVKSLSHEEVISRIEKTEDQNIIDAAARGAAMAIPMIANIAAMLIAFISILEFLNAIISWIGGMVGYPQLSFEEICSYVFIPIAFLMGVDWEDCPEVAELIGVKIFINEFVAYEILADFIKDGVLTKRSEIIATYALCGFDNLGAIGIQLGGISALAPSRRKDLADICIRALIAGSITCFTTACIAGLMYPFEELDIQDVNGTTTMPFTT